MKVIILLIIVLALAGAIDSGYALSQHYATANASSCDVNETISCTAVNQSEYSEVAGIPVAAVGIAGYVMLGVLAGVALVKPQKARLMFLLLALVSLGGFSVAICLTYIELFILKAVCPLCVISQGLILAIMVLAWAGALRNRFMAS